MIKPVLIGVFFCIGAFLCGPTSAQFYFPNENADVPNFGRCITPNRERALCLILNDCKYLFNLLLQTPLQDSDRLYLSRSQCGYQNGKVLICCPDRYRDYINVPSINPTTTKPPPIAPNNLLPQPGQCGNVLANRIYGGNVTKIDEFPWMALIEYTKQFYRNFNSRDGRFNYGPCITPNGKTGTCIVLQQCKKLYTLVTTQPLHDVNRIYLSQSQCGYINGKVLVCCPNYNLIANTATQAFIKPIYPKMEMEMKKSMLMDKTSLENTETKILPRPGQCGHITSGRIYGGNATEIDEFPWMALIGYTKPFGQFGHHCGGSLINSRYVLTASHCVNGKALPFDWKISTVRLGEWDTNTNPDCQADALGAKNCASPHIDVPIEKAIPHPKYDPHSFNQVNDIALIRLKETITFTDFIQPICLPMSSNLRNAVFDDIIMDVAGWGKTEKKSNSNVKLKAEVTGVSLDKCRQVYRPQNIKIDSSQLCAGGKRGVDSCRGDSGGPLIGLGTTGRGNTYYFLIGIVSFGPASCGTEGWPGVYTRVGHFVEWIQIVIES